MADNDQPSSQETHPSDLPTSKKERTPAQLEALQKARVKAAEVRAKNTELRRKERVSARAVCGRGVRNVSTVVDDVDVR